jgi:hypothetical protein
MRPFTAEEREHMATLRAVLAKYASPDNAPNLRDYYGTAHEEPTARLHAVLHERAVGVESLRCALEDVVATARGMVLVES